MIAEHAHIPAIRSAADRADLVAIADTNAERAEKIALQHNIPSFYADVTRMLEREKPQIVSICTSNAFHGVLCRMALETGANVFCEKPLTLSYSETKSIFDIASRTGRLVMACQTARVNPEIFAVRDLVADGALGKVYYAEINRIRRRGVPRWGAFHLKATNGGGAFCDIGVHQIDALLWMLGNPKLKRISGVSSSNIVREGETVSTSLRESGASLGVTQQTNYPPEAFEVEEFASGSMVLENNLAVNFKVAWAANLPDCSQLLLAGNKAGATLPDLNVWGVYHGMQADFKPRVLTEIPYADHPFKGHFFLVDNFASAVLGETEPFVLPAETINTAAVIDGFYRSVESGREIGIDEIKAGIERG